jgi:hypothetical protein
MDDVETSLAAEDESTSEILETLIMLDKLDKYNESLLTLE